MATLWEEVLMLRIVLLSFYSVMTLWGLDNYMIQVQSAMLPKLMLLDQTLPTTNAHAKITLAIVYDETSANEARLLAQSITKQQDARLGLATLNTVVIPIDAFQRNDDIQFIYLLETSPKKAKNLAQIANDKRIPIFAYNPDDLSNGALLSISVERKTIIYLSKTALKGSQHRFAEALYQVARLTD